MTNESEDRKEFEESITAHFANVGLVPCFDRFEDRAGGYADYYMEFAWIGFTLGRKGMDRQ